MILLPITATSSQYPETYFDANRQVLVSRQKRMMKASYNWQESHGVIADSGSFEIDILTDLTRAGFKHGTVGFSMAVFMSMPQYGGLKVINEAGQSVYIKHQSQVQTNLPTRGRLVFKAFGGTTEGFQIIPRFDIFFFEETVQFFELTGLQAGI